MTLSNKDIQTLQDFLDHTIKMIEKTDNNTQAHHYWDGRRSALQLVLNIVELNNASRTIK